MGQFIKSELEQERNPRSFKMIERLMPFADYGSRAPISKGNQREFRITNNDIGIKVKTNRVKSLNIRDHSLTKLAELAKEDARYTRMVHHLERGTPLNMIEQDCELRELRGSSNISGSSTLRVDP